MIAKILLLIISQVRVRPVTVFNTLDAFKESGTRNIHFFQHSIFEIGAIELCHFHIYREIWGKRNEQSKSEV